MIRFETIWRSPFLAVLLALTAACDDPAAPGESTVAPGVYALVSVDGDALPSPNRSFLENGTLELAPLGMVRRRVTTRFGAEPVVNESSGSYRVSGTTIELALHESNGYVWRVRGIVDSMSITLRYPHPADGETTERYER